MENNVRTNKEFDRYIMDLPNEIQSIAVTLREVILNSSKELVEEFKWSMPNYSYKGLVCYLQTASKHVNLGFHRGKELQEKDINNLLQGSGKTMMHITIKKIEEIKSESLTNLIQEAMGLNES